ncbi:MAG: GWxTD domain-containing protein [Candidatus Aminicenantes bacterium]|nr:GWxTD domain-containing protein [Candidatus Aminicenantes bacterium]
MRKTVYFVLLIFGSLLLLSCASARLEKNLDPESKEFISKVRFIITKKERKVFLNLPASEREAFVGEFWKSRDPDPDTEENEYKDEYFKRIDEANHLFKEGATPGWLQDRGRIYILLGSPWERETYPRGITFYGKPTEIWRYGWFEIVFIDNYWNGNYKLEPLSSWQIAELNKAQMDLKPKGSDEKYPFEFDLAVKKTKKNVVSIQVKIPYKNFWFQEKKDQLETTLALTLEIFDSSMNKVWGHQEDYVINLSEKELEETIVDEYIIELQVQLEHGDYSLYAELENQADGNRAWKKAKLTL